ncbi:MAG TPA: hypothetical protein VFC46_07160 [Humisphaera sp.]|nr:hypothetical protein [Humisphaera sp.]
MTISNRTFTSVVYDIRQDTELLVQMRQATLSRGDLGLSGENGIVGSPQWWTAVERGDVPIKVFEGTILRVDGGPMGDSCLVRIQGTHEMKSWTAWKGFAPSLIGQRVEIRYAEVAPKKPPTPGYLVDLLVEVRVL